VATGLSATGLTTPGLTTPGLPNRPTAGDPSAPALSTAAATESAASEPSVDPNADPAVAPNPDSWRVEVAHRLERYRTRRKPRSPRYPSLLLPFDAPESWSRPAQPTGSAGTGSAEIESAEIGSAEVATAPARTAQGFTCQTKEEPPAAGAPSFAEPRPASQPAQEPSPEPSAKVIEFPRSAAIPVFQVSDLADPVFDRDRPRIVEAPEMLPPPPALGGMLIESAQQEAADRRADSPSAFPSAPSASIAQRALAALVDGVVLATALAAFATIFLRLNPTLNPVRGPFPMHPGPMLAGPALSGPTLAAPTLAGPMLSGPTLAVALAVVAVLLWKAYEFLFVVYTGSTPGLRAARLRLVEFDGSPLNRRLRRWRVLASCLSAFSAGLGYLWCVLDQDGLCWHDRITRTHVQSQGPTKSA
jgi:uncharacterized RDD family membrane protein YckC